MLYCFKIHFYLFFIKIFLMNFYYIKYLKHISNKKKNFTIKLYIMVGMLFVIPMIKIKK